MTKLVKADNQLVTEMPDFMKQMTSSRGTENVSTADLVIPRLELIQSLSPCRKKSDPSYIEGADEGMLYNNVTRELYGNSVLVVPVYFKKEYLLWKDRKQGGGFRGSFDSEAEAQRAIQSLDDGEHCEIVDTAQHFCLLLREEGRAEEIVISCSKTKMKMSRKWNSLVRLNLGDSFSRVYKVFAISETNSRSQDYFNLTVAPAGFPTEAIYRQAESLYESISAGAVQVDRRSELDDSEF